MLRWLVCCASESTPIQPEADGAPEKTGPQDDQPPKPMAALDTAAEPGATIDLNRYTKPTSIALKARHVETQPDALAGLSLEERAKVQRARC